MPYNFLVLGVLARFGDRQDVHVPLNEAYEAVHDVWVERKHDELTSGGHVMDIIQQSHHPDPAVILPLLLRRWTSFARGFDYWPHAGTLLGQHCRAGLLYGDDDLDIGMMAGDLARLAVVAQQDQRTAPGTKLVMRAGLHSDIIGAKFVDTSNGLFIDIAVFHNADPMRGDSSVVHYWSNGVCRSCERSPVRLVLPRADIWPLHTCLFNDVPVSCPHRVADICAKMYSQPYYNCGSIPA